MKKALIALFVCSAALAGGIARGDAGNSPPMLTAAPRDLNQREARMIYDMLFSGRTKGALAYLDSIEPFCKGEPRFLLTRARAIREMLPVDDEQKAVLASEAATMYTSLDGVIDVCTRRIDAGSMDDELYAYRGWAWMLKSHVRTFERSMWAAGRDAKKGKADLEYYLSLHPGEPVASSIMGAFLYFADTLPGAMKFVSKLLFLPGGDRAQGLDMMELAVGWNSIMEADNRLILYSVYIGFEGRYEAGLEGFEGLRRAYPNHMTFLRPAVFMYLLKPRHDPANDHELDAEIDRVTRDVPTGETEDSTRQLIYYLRAHADRFYAPERALERLRKVSSGGTDHPDWVPGYARFVAGRILAGRGDASGAVAMFQSVIDDPRMEYLRGDCKSFISAIGEQTPVTLPPSDRAVAAYRPETAAETAAYFGALKNPTAADRFYLGEALLTRGDLGGALAAYRDCVDGPATRWDEDFQMIAATRAGEIAGSLRRYEEAARYFDKAIQHRRREFLYDWIFEGRKGYFKRLAAGEEKSQPRWLTMSQ